MLKIKIFAVVFILGLVGIVLNGSHQFSVSANDAAKEIVKYKSWSRITKERIEIEINEAAVSG